MIAIDDSIPEIPRGGHVGWGIFRSDPLARRITLGIVAFSTLIAIATTSIQLYIDYSRDLAGIEDRFREIERAQIPTLVSSLWALDTPQLKIQLDGLLQLPDIESASISSEGKPLLSAGLVKSYHRMARTYELRYRSTDLDMSIGELEIVASIDNARGRIASKLYVVLLTNAVKTFLVSLFALFLFYSLVTRHISRAAVYLGQKKLLTPAVGDLVLSRRKRSTSFDLLDQLVAAINGLRRNLLGSQQGLGSLFEMSPIGIARVSRDGLILAANPALSRMLGYTDEELKVTMLPDLISREHAGDDKPRIDLLLAAESSDPVETDLVRKDGIHVVARLHSAALASQDGEAQIWLTVDDVSEQRKIESALLASERRLNSFFVGAPTGMSIVDHEARWSHVNPTLAQWIGLPVEEIVGRRPSEIYEPEFAAKTQAAFERVLATGESEINSEIAMGKSPTSNSVRHLLSTRFPLSIREGRTTEIGIVTVDRTALKEAEEKLRQSQKMDAIGQLTGGIAHDFNNILTVITGTVEMLAEGVADRPELSAIAHMIDDAAARGAGLTRQLLAFARKQPLQPREIDVNAMITEAANLLRPTLGEQIEVETVLGEGTLLAMADSSELSSALLNLAINARDGMPNGGKLTLESSEAILDEAYVEANPDAELGPYVMIAVSDTGSGIPVEYRDRIFEPFFTTKETGKGTGLGLSMVYGFVRQSRGHIKVYSEVGLGTTMRMYLPRVAGPSNEQPAVPDVGSSSQGKETILVVEDDEMVRAYVLAQLRSLGYATLSAGNAVTALALVDQDMHFDLLFTDVIMPGGMNGRMLADEVIKRRPAMKILFTSGYAENAIIHHGRLDAGVNLLTKPYRKADMARKLREVLAAT